MALLQPGQYKLARSGRKIGSGNHQYGLACKQTRSRSRGKRFESARRLSILFGLHARLIARGVVNEVYQAALLSQGLVHNTLGGVLPVHWYPVGVALKSYGYAGASKQVLD